MNIRLDYYPDDDSSKEEEDRRPTYILRYRPEESQKQIISYEFYHSHAEPIQNLLALRKGINHILAALQDKGLITEI